MGPCYIVTRFVQALGSPPPTNSTVGSDVTRCGVVDIYRLFLSPCFLRNFTRRWRQRVYFLCIYCTLQTTRSHILEYDLCHDERWKGRPSVFLARGH